MNMIMVFSLLLVSLVTIVLLKLMHDFIWIPLYVQRMMRSQGITGPSYKFIHGCSKESAMIKQQALKNPMKLSHYIFSRVQPQYYTWMTLYGKNYLTWSGSQPQMVITEPELAKEIHTNKDGVFIKFKAKGALKKFFGDGLILTADKKKWLKLRKLANHAFYAKSLKDMIPAMIASLESMLQRWKDYEGKEIEVYKDMTELTSEVISRTAFGSSYVEGKTIFEMLTKLGTIVVENLDNVRPWGIDKILKTQSDVESDKLEKSLRDSITDLVRRREEKVRTGTAEDFGNDFLGMLLAAHHDPDKKNRITMDHVIDECKVFFIAGHDTTTSLLSWSCFLLAIHADWQEKARKEVLEIFGKNNPTAEGLPGLKTVNMIINETLRLYSPVGLLIRRTARKVKLGNYMLPSDMELHVPILALHMNTEIWGSDPHLFKPERFEEGVAKATRNNPAAFVPFGQGSRICVGLNFANNEAKIALSMILQRYKFTLSPNYVHAPFARISTRPQYGLQLMLQPL